MLISTNWKRTSVVMNNLGLSVMSQVTKMPIVKMYLSQNHMTSNLCNKCVIKK